VLNCDDANLQQDNSLHEATNTANADTKQRISAILPLSSRIQQPQGQHLSSNERNDALFNTLARPGAVWPWWAKAEAAEIILKRWPSHWLDSMRFGDLRCAIDTPPPSPCQNQTSAVAAAGNARPRRAAAVAPLRAKKKGFSGDAQAAGVKVNSRGKISSRPGPPSRKQQQQQQLDQAATLEQQQSPSSPRSAAATSTTTTSSSSPAAPAAATTSYSPTAPTATETPQAVIDRMAKRVAGFAVAPVVAGVGSLGVFWYLKVIAKVDYPIWMAYVGSSLMFGGGLLGITVSGVIAGGGAGVGSVSGRPEPRSVEARWLLPGSRPLLPSRANRCITYLRLSTNQPNQHPTDQQPTHHLTHRQYGILSTSWDPRREGSFWGWTEVQANIAVLMDKGKR